MQPIVQNQKTGCGQQTAGIHHLGDSIEKSEVHPLKIKKKQDNIIPRTRTEMFDSGDQIRLPGKKPSLHQPKTSKTFENYKQNWP